MGNSIRIHPSFKQLDSTMQAVILTLLSVSMVFADHAPAYGYGPQIHCRNTTNAVTAEVCVPAFAEKITEITLAVKEVQDNDYCYEQIKTVCEITETINQHELCTYSYVPKTDILPAQVTQVTYAEKSETMKVTNCKASGYGDHYKGEHQICAEEYQTQAYKVPLVTAPLDITVELTNPEPVETCVIKDIILTVVKCEDIVSQRCFNVAKLVDNVNVVEQQDIIIGEPNCNAVTLELPTQSCSIPYKKH